MTRVRMEHGWHDPILCLYLQQLSAGHIAEEVKTRPEARAEDVHGHNMYVCDWITHGIMYLTSYNYSSRRMFVIYLQPK